MIHNKHKEIDFSIQNIASPKNQSHLYWSFHLRPILSNLGTLYKWRLFYEIKQVIFRRKDVQFV